MIRADFYNNKNFKKLMDYNILELRMYTYVSSIRFVW